MTLGPLFLTEDKALRELLTGMTVHDQRADAEGVARPVGVWFGMPDQEIRNQNYPYMTIDLIDILEDRTRAMRGHISPSYLAPTNLAANKGWEIDYPIPVNLDYQITTYARQPRHDRELLTQLLYTKLPFRFGTLLTADDTIRRLDVLDVSKRDTVEQGKRLFMNAVTIRISTEIAQTAYKELYKVQDIKLSGPAVSRHGKFAGPISKIITG
jgi:hypothetical protein